MKNTLKLSVILLLSLIAGTVFSGDKMKENPSESGETVIGDVVSDAARAAMGTDIAIVAASSIGAAPFPEKVTEDNLAGIVPFGNETVVAVRISGADFREALERSVSFLPKRFGGFLQVSGVSFTCDPNKKSGERIAKILVGGEPLDDEADYTVALTEFLAGGGNGYKSLRKGEPIVEEGISLGEIALEYAKAPGKGKPPTRITIISLKDSDS